MKKIIAMILTLGLACSVFTACGSSNGTAEQSGSAATETSGSETATSEDAEASEGTDETAGGDTVKVAVLVKSFDSESWQYMLTGARNAAADSNGAIEITEHGADSEADIEGQVAVLEDVIVSEPDAIVITPSDSEAVVAALDEAYADGIKIVVVDTAVNTESYDVFMANDNYAGGEVMAEQLVGALEDAGKELKGTVGIVSAVPVQTVYDRDDGFIDKLAELAPDITVISEQYVDNDMQKSMDLTNDFISTYEDLIGVYGDNNVTGSGVALAIAEAGLQGEVIGVAYDGNPEEIEGINNGALHAILVQDLYNWGYQAVNFAGDLVNGKDLGLEDKYYNTGVTLVTKENIDDEDIQDVLDPSRLARN